MAPSPCPVLLYSSCPWLISLTNHCAVSLYYYILPSYHSCFLYKWMSDYYQHFTIVQNVLINHIHHIIHRGGLDTEFPIFHTTAYFGPVYYNDCSALPRYITLDPNNQFWKSLRFWVQCNEHSNFWWKINFPRGIIKKCYFFMIICHTTAQSTSHLLQWLFCFWEAYNFWMLWAILTISFDNCLCRGDL
jgi:hypothetical protein